MSTGRLPAGKVGSLFGAVAGLLLVVLIPAIPDAIPIASRLIPGDQSAIRVLGTSRQEGGEPSLSSHAMAIKQLALSQLKFDELAGMESSIRLIPDDGERGVVIHEFITIAIRRAELDASTDIPLSTIDRYLKLSEDLADPAEKCLCLSKLMELRKHVAASGEPTFSSLSQQAQTAAQSINAAPWYTTTRASLWGLLYLVGGFVVTNLIAALLSEVGKQIAKSVVEKPPTNRAQADAP